jgi:hypothetical protein
MVNMAKSNAGILLIILGAVLIGLVLFGGTIVTLGTQLINNFSNIIADFFKNLPGGGNNPTPTPTPTATDGGGNPTPTPTGGTGSFHVTVIMDLPSTNIVSTYYCAVWLTNTANGVIVGDVHKDTVNPSGTETFTFNSGDRISFRAGITMPIKFDHFSVSGGGNSNTNPLVLTIDRDLTITAHFYDSSA